MRGSQLLAAPSTKERIGSPLSWQQVRIYVDVSTDELARAGLRWLLAPVVQQGGWMHESRLLVRVRMRAQEFARRPSY